MALFDLAISVCVVRFFGTAQRFAGSVQLSRCFGMLRIKSQGLVQWIQRVRVPLLLNHDRPQIVKRVSVGGVVNDGELCVDDGRIESTLSGQQDCDF